MRDTKWILDAGHGGMIDGIYQTNGKRSPIWDDASQLFEGENIRKIIDLIVELNDVLETKLDLHILVPENEDISLKERVRRVNLYHSHHSKTQLVSLHHNAGGGTGFEVFTSRGETKSDWIATDFIDQLEDDFGDRFRFRKDYSDGDADKEANFYILKNSSCPAILVEMLFMDRYEPDYKLMNSDSGRNELAKSILMSMIRYDNY